MDGGLELMLPGEYFKIMKTVQTEVINGEKQDFDYPKLKVQFMENHRTPEFNNFEIPKIGYALQTFA